MLDDLRLEGAYHLQVRRIICLRVIVYIVVDPISVEAPVVDASFDALTYFFAFLPQAGHAV